MNQSAETAAAEIRRMHYLQAMGVETYVSRRQLPGAAPSQRLTIIPAAAAAPVPATPQHESHVAKRGPAPEMPRLDAGDGTSVKPSSRQPSAASKPAAARSTDATPALTFSLGVVICGDVAWVEALDYPLAREQVQLIQAMARAVGATQAKPKVAQFDWPMHNNPQLDQGEAAARASLAAYLDRHLSEANCRAVVSLGDTGTKLTPVEALSAFTCVATHSTRDMLENPTCKRKVWADLQVITAPAEVTST
ncbi:hypothetical protein EY643_03950 [Halioglobus maricola]|uniref:Uncharacterized protein n=1 Tax=Halioglobus maricola TaxID=2601894 RepID=A0A5P9NIS9_9GAMM|nr:hypothetical protein [Halioglobus maricola]QFU74858.1 hypothetical protein EY643_03950 [Halioglobus maricola]